MELRFDEKRKIAHIRMSGALSSEEILGAFDAAVSDDRYRDGMGRLWDLREADLSSLDAQIIVSMAQYSLKYPPGVNDAKVAFVTARDLEFGLSRMFELSSKANTPIRVFREMREAEEWLAT